MSIRKVTLLTACVSISLATMAQQKTRVDVFSLQDFPDPKNDGKIELQSFTNYVVHGTIDLGESYIQMNGASLTGEDPGKDGVTSKVPGPIIRSFKKMVYLETFLILVGSDQGSGFLFEDPSQKRYCNIFQGVTVMDAPGVKSNGVGTIKGFNTTHMELGYWNTADGLKVGGEMVKFVNNLNYITGLTNGTAVEFLDDAKIGDLILKDNFVLTKDRSNTGFKVNSGAVINRARMDKNLFKGVESHLEGVTSFTPGWEMRGNGSQIPDTRVKAFVYMKDNVESTEFDDQYKFKRIRGRTRVKRENKLNLEGDNRIVYQGKKKQTLTMEATVRGNSSNYSGSYTIGFKVNEVKLIQPTATVRGIAEGDPFTITMQTETEVKQGDEISLYIKSNKNPKLRPLIVNEYTINLYN